LILLQKDDLVEQKPAWRHLSSLTKVPGVMQLRLLRRSFSVESEQAEEYFTAFLS
jgi:hypothetical protein